VCVSFKRETGKWNGLSGLAEVWEFGETDYGSVYRFEGWKFGMFLGRGCGSGGGWCGWENGVIDRNQKMKDPPLRKSNPQGMGHPHPRKRKKVKTLSAR
jgi:hypothetical protein